jgi:hypothetical protein
MSIMNHLGKFRSNAIRTMKVAKARVSSRSSEKVFSEYYNQNAWGSGESRSGGGSELEATASIRRELPRIFEQCKIRTLIDAPCGDMNWIKLIISNLESYTGVDVVPDLIKNNEQCYGSERRRFLLLDLTREKVPKADMILCRHCLQHLTIDDNLKIIYNFKESRSEYLLITQYPNTTKNRDAARGEFWPRNLCIYPFDLPRPIEMIADGQIPPVLGGLPKEYGNGECFLALWRIDDIRF